MDRLPSGLSKLSTAGLCPSRKALARAKTPSLTARSGSARLQFGELFKHAVIRHTVYSELNSARRVRLHRKIAEEMERMWGERAANHAAEVAFHFWRGAAASGADRGTNYALAFAVA